MSPGGKVASSENLCPLPFAVSLIFAQRGTCPLQHTDALSPPSRIPSHYKYTFITCSFSPNNTGPIHSAISPAGSKEKPVSAQMTREQHSEPPRDSGPGSGQAPRAGSQVLSQPEQVPTPHLGGCARAGVSALTELPLWLLKALGIACRKSEPPDNMTMTDGRGGQGYQPATSFHPRLGSSTARDPEPAARE